MGVFLSTPQYYCADPTTGCSKKSYEYAFDKLQAADNPELTAFLGDSVANITARYPDQKDLINYINQKCQAKFPGSVGKSGMCCDDSLKGTYDGLKFNADGTVNTPNSFTLNAARNMNGEYEICSGVACGAANTDCLAKCKQNGYDQILDRYGVCRAAVIAANKDNTSKGLPSNACPTMCTTPSEESQSKSSGTTQSESTDSESTDSESMNSEELNTIISVPEEVSPIVNVPEESVTVAEAGEESYTTLYIGIGVASLLLLILCIVIIILAARSSD